MQGGAHVTDPTEQVTLQAVGYQELSAAEDHQARKHLLLEVLVKLLAPALGALLAALVTR